MYIEITVHYKQIVWQFDYIKCGAQNRVNQTVQYSPLRLQDVVGHTLLNPKIVLAEPSICWRTSS